MRKWWCAAIGVICILVTGISVSAEEKENKEFWLFSAQKYWDSVMRPGIRNGESRTQFYLDRFTPLIGDEQWFLFLNSKAVLDDSESHEKNIGVGIRSFIFDERVIAGANFFYDRKKSEHSNIFHQLGCGAELLSKYFDLRVNGYFSLSDKKHLSDDVSYKFGQTSLLRVTTSHYEEPLSGMDYEAGAVIPFISEWIEARAYAGGFHYFSDLSDDIHGIRLRAEVSPLRCLTFDFELTDDNQTSDKHYVGAHVSLPFSIGKLLQKKNPFQGWTEYLSWNKGPRELKMRMTDRIIRDLDIISQAAADSPKESEEIPNITFVYKKNGRPAVVGKGTHNNPYTSLADGIANVKSNGVIYLIGGAGTYQTGLTLPKGVTLWGSNYVGPYKGLMQTAAPVIQGTALAALSLEGDNVLQGVSLRNEEGSYGLYAKNASKVVVKFVNILCTNSTSGTTGIYHLVDEGTSTLSVYNSTIEAKHTDLVFQVESYGVLARANNNAILNCTLSNNSITASTNQAVNGCPHSVFMHAKGNSTVTSTIKNNNIYSIGSYVFGIESESTDNATANTHVSFNTIDQMHGLGVTAIISRGMLKGRTDAFISNNSVNVVNAFSGYGIKLEALEESNNNFRVENNLVTGFRNMSDGVGIVVASNQSAGMNTVTIRGNTVKDFDIGPMCGVRIGMSNKGITNALLENNIFSLGHSTDGHNYGLYFEQQNDTINVDLGNGTLGSRGRNSIYTNDTDVYVENFPGTISAEYNWWGSANPNPVIVGGNVDYEPFLTSDPQ